MNIQKYQDLISEIKVNSDKSTTWSVRGTARLCGIDESSIRESFKTAAGESPSKLAESLTHKGFQPAWFSSDGIPDEAVALIVEYYAFDAGKRCKDKAKDVYRILGKVGIRVFSLSVTGHNLEVKENVKPSSNPSELEVLEFCLNPLKDYVDKALVDGVRLNYAERKYPELKGELNEMRSLIAGTNKIDTVLLTPTKVGLYLGERLGVKYSAKLINQLLIENGYQIVNCNKTSKDDPKYLPTKKGLPFSNMSLATGKVGDNTSYQHLKWLESLVDELENIVKV